MPGGLIVKPEKGPQVSESDIWRHIARHPGDIGYPGALPLTQVQLGRHGGYIDLVLLPDQETATAKLVLVEAKRTVNADSSDKVIGQLLKYYARALRIGAEGLAGMRRYAEREAAGHARVGAVLTMRKIFGASSQQEGHARLEHGRPMVPADLALVIGLDGYHDKQARRLGLIVSTLKRHHDLPIDLFEVGKGVVKRCPMSEEDRTAV